MRILNFSESSRRALILPILLFVFALLFPFMETNAQKPVANPAIAEFEPALAVRASACITCHSKIRPSCITDFGYGDKYFFGNPVGGAKFGTFNGHIYGDFYGGEPNKTGWLTAEIAQKIIVPQASLDFDLGVAGAKLADQYKRPLQAKSLAQYLQELEKQKPSPATVIEKKTVFIGAPNATTLEARFDIASDSSVKTKYVKTHTDSPALEGIGLDPDKSFYTNIGEVVCDGDLLIRGTLFLNQVTIATKTGCRIYATGPVFLQGGITYKNQNGSIDDTNLQVVSAKAVLLGVGDKSCDPSSKESPLSRRLVSGYAVSTFMTRAATSRSISPQTLGEEIYAEGKLIPSLEDAACHSDSISFSRLLLNAPQVHCRYKGDFKGLIIAEFALFRLSKSNFEFDPVFKRVPLLPRLKDSDYLEVK